MPTDSLGILRRLFRKAVQQGRSKRRGEAYSLPYIEPLNAARTPLADFVNSLLASLLWDYPCTAEPEVVLLQESSSTRNNLVEDRGACVMEIGKSRPVAMANRQNPTAYPEYLSQVCEEMNRCIERKGWKPVWSPQEQKPLSEVITSEMAQKGQPMLISNSKSTQAILRAIENRLARALSAAQSATKKD